MKNNASILNGTAPVEIARGRGRVLPFRATSGLAGKPFAHGNCSQTLFPGSREPVPTWNQIRSRGPEISAVRRVPG
jgi:hypothetical protein